MTPAELAARGLRVRDAGLMPLKGGGHTMIIPRFDALITFNPATGLWDCRCTGNRSSATETLANAVRFASDEIAAMVTKMIEATE